VGSVEITWYRLVRLLKSRRLRGDGHVTRMGGIEEQVGNLGGGGELLGVTSAYRTGKDTVG
jgi:hypothetical protein